MSQWEREFCAGFLRSRVTLDPKYRSSVVVHDECACMLDLLLFSHRNIYRARGWPGSVDRCSRYTFPEPGMSSRTNSPMLPHPDTTDGVLRAPVQGYRYSCARFIASRIVDVSIVKFSVSSTIAH